MTRLVVLAGVLFALADPAAAQSEGAPSHTAVAGGATYSGVVSIQRSSTSLSDLRGPGAVLDATYGRFSVGIGVTELETSRPYSLAAGVHLARDIEAQRVTTLSLAVQGDERVDAFLPMLTHAQRVVHAPGLAILPSIGVGVAIPYTTSTAFSVLGSGSVAVQVGKGPARPTLVSTVAATRGQVDTVTLGGSLGLTVDLDRP